MLCLPSHTIQPPVYSQHFVSVTKDILPLERRHNLLPPRKYVHYQVLFLKSVYSCVEQGNVETSKKYGRWMEMKTFHMCCCGVDTECVETGTKNYVLQHQQFVCGRMSVTGIVSLGDNSCPRFLFFSL